MKNVVKTLVAAAGIAAVGLVANPAMAQVSTTSGNTIVTVTVTDVLALVVAVPAVPLAVGTLSEFQNGATFTAPAQLVASSNRPYEIRVQSGGNLQGTVNGGSIPISSVSVQTRPTLTTAYNAQLKLSTGIQPLITGAAAGMVKAYDVKYDIAGNDPNLYVKSDAYTATLTYSIIAQ